MKTSLRFAAIALAAAAVFPAVSQAADGQWMVRARAVHLSPANDDTIAITDVSVNKKWIPEVDISYFITPNIAAELILTYPQKHDVSSTTHSGKIGTLKHLPPTLTVQYHFAPQGQVRPYVGAGLNYTRFSNVDLPDGFSIDKNSFGLAFQAGLDVPLNNGLYLNVDVKKAYIRTDLTNDSLGNLGTIKVDPLLVGVGVGYRF